jgi:hypothetical protein
MLKPKDTAKVNFTLAVKALRCWPKASAQKEKRMPSTELNKHSLVKGDLREKHQEPTSA